MSRELQNLLADVEAGPDSPRARLVTQLLSDGAHAKEILEAHRQGRLNLLPLQRILEDEGEQTLRDIATRHDLDVDALAATRRALGVSVEPDKPVTGGRWNNTPNASGQRSTPACH